jgi:hypothetical protein
VSNLLIAASDTKALFARLSNLTAVLARTGFAARSAGLNLNALRPMPLTGAARSAVPSDDCS